LENVKGVKIEHNSAINIFYSKSEAGQSESTQVDPAFALSGDFR